MVQIHLGPLPVFPWSGAPFLKLVVLLTSGEWSQEKSQKCFSSADGSFVSSVIVTHPACRTGLQGGHDAFNEGVGEGLAGHDKRLRHHVPGVTGELRLAISSARSRLVSSQ
jgi:hypothetical protein